MRMRYPSFVHIHIRILGAAWPSFSHTEFFVVDFFHFLLYFSAGSDSSSVSSIGSVYAVGSAQNSHSYHRQSQYSSSRQVTASSYAQI